MLRKAGESSISGSWELICTLADLLKPTGCANYFVSCGYDPQATGTSLALRKQHADVSKRILGKR